MKSPNALPRAILKALSASQLLHRRRKEFEDVHRKPVVRDLKNRCARVRVDRNDRSRVLHPRYMLHRAADPARDVQLRPHGLPALTDLAGLREPLHVRERAGRTDDATKELRELLDEREVLLLLEDRKSTRLNSSH